MTKTYLILIPIFAIMSLYCCAQKDTSIEYGIFKDNTYINYQFDLSIEIPDNYYFMDKNNRQSLSKKNIENVFDTNTLSKIKTETSLDEMALIFTILKFKPDTIMEVNPNMTITVANISKQPSLKNIDHAVHQTIEGFKDYNSNLIIDEDIFDFHIGKRKFKGYNSSLTIDNMTANYESYLGNYDNFNMVITISYKTEEEKMELLQIVNGIKTWR